MQANYVSNGCKAAHRGTPTNLTEEDNLAAISLLAPGSACALQRVDWCNGPPKFYDSFNMAICVCSIEIRLYLTHYIVSAGSERERPVVHLVVPD